MSHVKIIESTPFPAIVLNKANIIISYNNLMDSCLDESLETGIAVTDYFSIWDDAPDSNVITASIREKSFIFIKDYLNDSDTKILVGTETAELSVVKEENKALKSLNRDLDAIIENSYDGIYITDKKGITWKTNSAIERITAIPKEYYIGKNVDDLVKRGILKNSVSKKVLELKRTVSYVQQNFAGKETLLTGTPVFNEEGEIEKIVTNIRDLSDLNDLQNELNKVNKLNDRYKEELTYLKNKPDQLDGIITKSKQTKMIYETAERIVNIDATVLILGETGVGKDVLAKYIFTESTRSKEGKFLKINCGAIPPDLLESELFGYEGGAFTGADRKGKPGMFELADKGILFMDEIGELPLALQVKLLRVLQEGEIQRIGAVHPKKVDVRIIAATNRNLQDMVASGDFREDLYYRINVIPILIPPLRDRRDDILPLIQLFLKQVNTKYQMAKELDYEIKEFFLSFDWPGNIRELSNLIERLAVTTRNDVINIDSLPPEYQYDKETTINAVMSLKEAAEIAEKKVITLAAEKHDNTYEIAKALESSQPTIVRKMKKYNIK